MMGGGASTRRSARRDGSYPGAATPSSPPSTLRAEGSPAQLTARRQESADAAIARELQRKFYAEDEAIRQAQLTRDFHLAYQQSRRFWLGGVLQESEPIEDHFVVLFGDFGDGNALFPSFPTILSTPPATTREAVLVRNITTDSSEDARRLLSIAHSIAALPESDVATRAVALASTVVEALGGDANDDQVLFRRFELSAQAARVNSPRGAPSCVLDLMRLKVGCARHRAILFKALSAAANVPCRLVLGLHVGDDSSAYVCLPPEHAPPDTINSTVDGETDECFIDLLAEPGVLRSGSEVRHAAMLRTLAATAPAPDHGRDVDATTQSKHLVEAFGLEPSDHVILRESLTGSGLEHTLSALELRERLGIPLSEAIAYCDVLLAECGNSIDNVIAVLESQRGAYKAAGKTSGASQQREEKQRARAAAETAERKARQRAKTAPRPSNGHASHTSAKASGSTSGKPQRDETPWSYGPSRDESRASPQEDASSVPPPPEQAGASTPPLRPDILPPHDPAPPPAEDRDAIALRIERETKGLSLCETLRRFGVHVEGGDSPSASQIRAAFRRAALQFHPDRARGDVEREEKFKVIRGKLDQ